jgi:phosphoribosylformimino-5-aminoimidazole carboxamide ribotide isomerase
MSFTIYPAIDLRQGRVVRLQHGDPARQTTFSDDPVAVARRWLGAGAAWLHVVNLDGAFDEQGLSNWEALQAIGALGGRVQFGGGVRSLKDVARAINRGAERVILGTAAIETPDVVAEAIDAFGPERVAVSLDARDGIVRTRGWQADGRQTAEDLALALSALGLTRVVHTDIGRDGVLSGVNVEATQALALATGLEVIASGGVRALEDVRRLLDAAPAGVGGVIIGRALYEGQVDLGEALRLAEGAAA